MSKIAVTDDIDVSENRLTILPSLTTMLLPLLVEAEALASACESRGIRAVILMLDASQRGAIRRQGLQVLARLSSRGSDVLLEAGKHYPSSLMMPFIPLYSQ